MFTLWFRADRRERWESVAAAGSHGEAVGLIGCGDRRGGDWTITASDRDPNASAQLETRAKAPARERTPSLFV